MTTPDANGTPAKQSGAPTAGNRRARPPAGHSRRRQLVLPVTVATVGLATLGVVQALPNRNAVQSQLTDRSTRALSAAGITGAQVEFDGRDATVHVRSAGDRDRALAIVRSQQGVRVAHVIVDRSGPGAGKTPSNRPSRRPTVPMPTASGPVPTAPARVPTASGPVPTASGPRAGGGPSVLPGRSGSASTPPGSVSPNAPAPGSPSPGAAEPAPSSGAPGSGRPPGDEITHVQQAVNACGPVQFGSASAALTPAGRKVVANVAAILRADTSVEVEIQGFTDSVGPALTNLALSRARARTVDDTLRVLGITAARMSPVGYGESRPRVSNDSRAHRAANRRVAFAIQLSTAR
ncbi:MAG TPA: OmpA family protein [Micromonosporaceae bacterium]|nr:OmpA family protein [Micromonosporaceae bacterium]